MRKLNTATKPVEILLVEDNPGDVVLTKKVFQSSKILNNINVAKDGELALQMLKKENGYLDFITPDIIILDLNLPKKDGREVLEVIKEDKTLRKIPVVILTSSKAEHDLIEAYDLYANSYVLKPVNLESFVNVVKAIESFWLSVVVLPDGE